MGLLSAISNAVSGLSINQQNLNVLSQNISNANTPNYSNEVVNQQASFIDGAGTGVTIAGITRNVSDFLNAEVQTQTSASSSASAVQSYYGQIENLLGQPGANNSIDSGINSFFTAVQDLANSPSVSAQTNVVNTATSVAGQISSLASSLYGLQLQSDTDISSAVSSVNTDLQTLNTVNVGLERATATGQSTAGLLDQRDAALNDMAQYINITPTFSASGEVAVTTAGGTTLLSTGVTTKLTYNAASGTQTFINNSALSPIQVVNTDTNGNAIGQPTNLTTSGAASSITTSITGGKLQGLLSIRDTVIPNILSQLDQLAGSLRDQVNAINNTGTSSPPPNSYTGTRLVGGSSISQYSGSIQIAVLNANGNPAPSPYADEPNGVQPLTIDLSALNTGQGKGVDSVDGIINTINQYYAPQNKTEIGNINNVQLGIVSNTIPDTGGTLNLDFNLNNISGGNANFYVSNVSVLDSSGNPVSTATSTQPSIALAANGTYQTDGSNNVTVTTAGTNNLTDGEVVYLNAPPGGTVTGLSSSALSGYFTVSNVTGSTFQISVAGASSATVGSYNTSSTVTALPSYATVDSGQTTSTQNNGVFTASLGTGSSPYYTVQANIATVDASGNLVQSTVSYRVVNNVSGSENNLIGASSQTGSATIVSPASSQPLVTASLVDANGNPLSKINGQYGNQQGYLKITADNSTQTISINELDSKQLGLPGGVPPQAGTNQGFSQYFGLNNFFNTNSLTATGDTTLNSALNLSVQSRIINNPGLVSTGTLSQSNQPTNNTAPPNFTYQISSGDNSVSQALAGLATSQFNFASIGGVPASTTTFSQYAGQLLATTSTNSSSATSSMNDSQTLLNGFTQRAQAVSGVNLDQELANTVIYQNAYAASTRVITIVSQMFTDLLGIIQ